MTKDSLIVYLEAEIKKIDKQLEIIKSSLDTHFVDAHKFGYVNDMVVNLTLKEFLTIQLENISVKPQIHFEKEGFIKEHVLYIKNWYIHEMLNSILDNPNTVLRVTAIQRFVKILETYTC